MCLGEYDGFLCERCEEMCEEFERNDIGGVIICNHCVGDDSTIECFTCLEVVNVEDVNEHQICGSCQN